MSSPVPLPFLTEADPDRLGEGSLDPLGLASIADRLADCIAPSVTARMSRARFLTAIAVGATMAGELSEVAAADAKATPYLAYEWIVVEALARRRPSAQTRGVPGIQKARRALARSWAAHLSAGGYLQMPKVFGFHGVYKRLARAAGYVDEELLLHRKGEELVRAWEREQRLPGFADRAPGTPGGRLARTLLGEARKALLAAGVKTSPSSQMWGKLAAALGPDDPGRRERRLLWEAVVDEREPVRRELILALRDLGSWQTEAQALRAIAPAASPSLRFRLTAIDSYERVAKLLIGVLQAMRIASTGAGVETVGFDRLAASELVSRASGELPSAMEQAAEWLGPLGEGAALEEALGSFAEPMGHGDLIEAVLTHHEGVQEAKGKRPWLERGGHGFYVREDYRTSDAPPGDDRYIHPYRVEALASFAADLAPGR